MSATGTVRAGRERQRLLRLWTRRIHFHLGLWLLSFIWFFSLSGLLLNHPEWDIARFWPRREETRSMHAIDVSVEGDDVEVAHHILDQLGIAGEIGTIERSEPDGRFTIVAVRPGRQYRVEALPDRGRATIVRTRLNAFGAADALHKFTGVRMDDPALERDWLLTSIWSIAMDAIAAGLLVLVVSGVYMWLRLGARRLAGSLFLAAGTITCALFLFGLTRLL